MKARQVGRGVGSGRRKMVVECLEQRAMLAGNVSVSVAGGNLIVTGDNKDNAVLIEQVGHGQYAVTGYDFADAGVSGFQSGPTKVNGSANGTFVASNVTGDIIVNLNKGNDVVAIGNSVDDLAALAEECGIGFGNGNGSGSGSGNGSGSGSFNETIAEAEFENGVPFYAPRNLIINTGDGNDGVIVVANVKDSAIINTGNGHDAVAVGGSFSSESRTNIGRDLHLLTGKGDDLVCGFELNVRGLLNIQTADGHDDVFVDEFHAGSVQVGTGNGHDYVDLDDFHSDREVFVNTGGGNDWVFVDDFSAGYVTVLTGAGNDHAEVTDFEADNVFLDTGAGNDGSPSDESPITVENALIKNDLVVLTGAGNDLLHVEDIVARSIIIDTGAGNDGTIDGNTANADFFSFPIAIYNVFVKNDLIVNTGAGNDAVYIYTGGEEEEASNIGRNLIVNTGAGHDFALIVDQFVGNDLILTLGAGNDIGLVGTVGELPRIQQLPGTGFGIVDIGHNLLIDAGAGNDLVGVQNVDIENDLLLFLGAGNDEAYLSFLDVDHNALIDAGAGHDDIFIDNSHVGDDDEEGNNGGLAQIFMGAGNDTLGIFGSTARKLKAFGGPGTDTFDNDLGIEGNGSYQNNGSEVEIREFEKFNFID